MELNSHIKSDQSSSSTEMLLVHAAISAFFFFSSAWDLVQGLVPEIRRRWNVFSECNNTTASAAAAKRCIPEDSADEIWEADTTEEKPEVVKQHCHENATDGEVTIEELKMVMEIFGTPYDYDGRKLQDKLSPKDITAMFDEQEPSLQEVQEAFWIFDKNNDGYVDAKELRLVLSIFCSKEFTEEECRSMIRTHDENGDGLIDINEFRRLVANSFS